MRRARDGDARAHLFFFLPIDGDFWRRRRGTGGVFFFFWEVGAHRAGDETGDEDGLVRGMETNIEGLLGAACRARLATLAHLSFARAGLLVRVVISGCWVAARLSEDS